FHCLLAIPEVVLLRKALQIAVDGVAGVHLAQLRQQLVLEGRLGRGRRLHLQDDHRLGRIRAADQRQREQQRADRKRSSHTFLLVRTKIQFRSAGGGSAKARKGGSGATMFSTGAVGGRSPSRRARLRRDHTSGVSAGVTGETLT